jgi:hypothetical protein
MGKKVAGQSRYRSVSEGGTTTKGYRVGIHPVASRLNCRASIDLRRLEKSPFFIVTAIKSSNLTMPISKYLPSSQKYPERI